MYVSTYSIPQIVAQTQITAHDMLEQSHSLSLNELVHHVAEHSSNGVETFVCLANVRQSGLVEQDFLNNEDGDGLGELGARLHDAQAEGYDLGRQEEVYDSVVVVLLKLKPVITRPIAEHTERR